MESEDLIIWFIYLPISCIKEDCLLECSLLNYLWIIYWVKNFFLTKGKWKWNILTEENIFEMCGDFWKFICMLLNWIATYLSDKTWTLQATLISGLIDHIQHKFHDVMWFESNFVSITLPIHNNKDPHLLPFFYLLLLLGG